MNGNFNSYVLGVALDVARGVVRNVERGGARDVERGGARDVPPVGNDPISYGVYC